MNPATYAKQCPEPAIEPSDPRHHGEEEICDGCGELTYLYQWGREFLCGLCIDRQIGGSDE